MTDIQAGHGFGALDVETDLLRALGEALDLTPVDDRDAATRLGEEVGRAPRILEANLRADEEDQARLLIAGRDDLRIGAWRAARWTASARRGEMRKVSRRGNTSPSMN